MQAAHHTLISSQPATDHALPQGFAARVWINARCFFSRQDAQDRCWLWLLLDNGELRAATLPAKHLGRDDLLADFAAVHAFAGDQAHADLPHGMRLLPRAPVVPIPNWRTSWGHPLHVAIRAFADRLDHDVLHALGHLETAGSFFGSVGNYNRLREMPEPIRERRMQALLLFPPLLSHLLLDPYGHPELFGQGEDDQDFRAPPVSPQLLHAIDQGRDLIGALAHHYRIDRALVRAPLCRESWNQFGIPWRVLQLLHAIPAHARPQTREQLQFGMDLLSALPCQAHGKVQHALFARAFWPGGQVVWQELAAAYPNLRHALVDSRDFLDAAFATLEPDRISRNDLALTWLASRGIRSLLAASVRWHAQPVTTTIVDPREPDRITAWFDEHPMAGGHARELLTRQALIDEGETMQHCVADYWSDCVYGTGFSAIRIVHLQRIDADGTVIEQATAELGIDADGRSPHIELHQLRGNANAESSVPMQELAATLQAWLGRDDPEARERLRQVVEDAIGASNFLDAESHRTSARALDRRSRDELTQVLNWALRNGIQRRDDAIEAGYEIAGFRFAEGPRVLSQLQCGDALTLVREPDNPHDPRAVRIDWQGHKLGYIPRDEIRDIAQRLDRHEVLHAHIVAIREQDSWAPVRIGVSCNVN